MKERVTQRFLKYVAVDTQSDEASDTFPSTEKQKVLAKMLVEELRRMGVPQVEIDEQYGYVYAKILSNRPDGEKVPVLGFIAHMDTSPEVSGADVKPQIIRQYDGKDIVLNKDKNIVLSVEEFPELVQYTGQTLITTDGTTLLGADDKAGVAEIMTMAEQLCSHPEIVHGDIAIAFTPDEEVGGGMDHFDVGRFGADYAYTVDGGALGELEYENFNAASATLTVNGVSIHPGSAKNVMKNAIDLFAEFHSLLPVWERPAHTENYEGFYMADEVTGGVEKLVAKYIIRDHDRGKFADKKRYFAKISDFLNDKYGNGTFVADIRDSYYNMSEIISENYHLIDNAVKAMKDAGVEPFITPIRGGTDGARLSFNGLPCPNLSTGGFNFHGRKEFIPSFTLEKMTEVIINIVKVYAE